MIRIRQISVSILNDQPKVIKEKIAKKLHISVADIITWQIYKKSIDARNKKNILYKYEVNVSCKEENKILKKNQDPDILFVGPEEYVFPLKGKEKLNTPIVVVGSGPAGLFAAYLLALEGYKPIVIERGESMEKRILTVNSFWQKGHLNLQSNVQFGEGGAGTFSDGKLNTQVGDHNYRGKKILETFVQFGAPKDILYLQKPHIGTDVLRKVIVNLRNAIIKMGGKFYYETCLTNIFTERNRLCKIELNHEKIMDCEHLVLAIGHSARDTFSVLYDQNVQMQAKPFAVGVRVEHPQAFINESQYGDFASLLPPATYKLTYQASNHRGVYSFCMCPGGYVINASSTKDGLAIKGMSNRNRDSKNANSALVVTVTPNDFGFHPLDGMKFQETLEKKAKQIGNGGIPLQLYKDYKKNQTSIKFGTIKPEMKGKFTFANLNQIFPSYINCALKEAIAHFGTKIEHFDCDDMILSGVESRTSSPVRITRDENFEATIQGIYPCGEGAGYAGGIMTAAMDGLKVAEAIIKKYSN